MLSPLLLSVLTVASAPRPFAVALSSFVKVRPGSEFLGSPDGKLSAARGECEALQFRVAEGRKDVKFEAAPLTGPGKAIGPTPYVERFISVTTPSNSEGATGLWPDPLVPLADAGTQSSTSE